MLLAWVSTREGGKESQLRWARSSCVSEPVADVAVMTRVWWGVSGSVLCLRTMGGLSSHFPCCESRQMGRRRGNVPENSSTTDMTGRSKRSRGRYCPKFQ